VDNEITDKTKVSLTMSTLISVLVVVIGLPVYAVGFLDSRYGSAATQAELKEAIGRKADRENVVSRTEYVELKQKAAYTAETIKEIRGDVKELLKEQRRAAQRAGK